MKRTFVITMILSILVSGIPIGALANGDHDVPPKEVIELWNLFDDIAFLDYISFQLPDGSEESYLLDELGWLYGFRCENGEWRCITQVSPIDRSWSARFIRHNTLTRRADGSVYPNALGFDLYCTATGKRLSYHYDGTQFVLCGWENPYAYKGEVILKDLTAMYYPTGSTIPEERCVLENNSNSMLMNFDDLPFTPAEGMALSSISEYSVRDYFPGYTLRGYYTYYNMNTASNACYSRIENGRLYVKRALFSIEANTPYVTDCMPVPLSERLLERLAKEPFDQLLNITGATNLFLSEAAFDTDQIPVMGRIVYSTVMSDALILLAEDELGISKVHIVTADESGYRVQSTRELPTGTRLDILHADDGQVILEWNETVDGENQNRIASFICLADGTWKLYTVMNGLPEPYDYRVYFCGIEYDYYIDSTDGIYIGTTMESDLMQIGLSTLPRNKEQLLDVIDRSGWAEVNAPSSTNRACLLPIPDTNSVAIGEFYSGTPVKVMQEQGDWCQIEIGTDGRITGWMPIDHLAFGNEMDEVMCAFPQLILLQDDHDGRNMFTSTDMKEMCSVDGALWIVGVIDDMYIILTPFGQTAFAPMDWFSEGNG